MFSFSCNSTAGQSHRANTFMEASTASNDILKTFDTSPNKLFIFVEHGHDTGK